MGKTKSCVATRMQTKLKKRGLGAATVHRPIWSCGRQNTRKIGQLLSDIYAPDPMYKTKPST